MAKTHNLQPLLDYFSMLHTYIKRGYLEIQPEKHEAFVTGAAFATLIGVNEERIVPVGSSDGSPLLPFVSPSSTELTTLVRHIRDYSAWKDMAAPEYCAAPFALHVVRDAQPHDLCVTILLTRRRCWYTPWRKTDHIEVITYTEEDKS